MRYKSCLVLSFVFASLYLVEYNLSFYYITGYVFRMVYKSAEVLISYCSNGTFKAGISHYCYLPLAAPTSYSAVS